MKDGIDWVKLDSLLERLDTAQSEIVGIFANMPSSEVRDLRFLLFANICDAIYEAAAEYHDYEKPFSFYFWPGYDSIRTRATRHSRVEISGPGVDNMISAAERSLRCGLSPHYAFAGAENEELERELRRIGGKRETFFESCILPRAVVRNTTAEFGFKDNSIRLLSTYASVWFNVFLTPPDSGSMDSIMPGSTHEWLKHAATRKIDGRTLRGLIVNHRVGSTEETNGSGFLHCDVGDPDMLGEELGIQLDEVSGQEEWPVILGAERKAVDRDAAAVDLGIRRRLYTIWLHALFVNGSPDSIQRLVSKSEVLKNDDRCRQILRKHLKMADTLRGKSPKLLEFVQMHSNYSHWYSLSLPSVLTNRALSDDPGHWRIAPLGTGMVFSQFPLKIEFLSVLRWWLSSAYGLFRQTESRADDEIAGAYKVVLGQVHELHKMLLDARQKLFKPEDLSIHLELNATSEPVRSVDSAMHGDPNSYSRIAWPADAVIGRLDYVGAWLSRAGIIPRELGSRPSLNKLVQALCTKAANLAAASNVDNNFYGKKIESLIERQEKITSIEASLIHSQKQFGNLDSSLADSTVQEPLDNSERPNYAVAAFCRLFYSCYFNAVKHALLTGDGKPRVWVSCSVPPSRERVVLTVENNFNRSNNRNGMEAAKDFGTRMAMEVLGAPFGVGFDDLEFGQQNSERSIWTASLVLSFFFTNIDGRSERWVRVG